MKLVSRAAWGARGYRLPSGATLYSRARRGVKLHYLGSAYTDRAHDRCDDYVRQLQASHMDGNGWSDIGYSFVVCTHGYVYEGRGLRRRNSANGNTTLNEQDYAVCLLVGSSGLTVPTDAQLDGARDAIDYCRTEGPAGSWLGGHRDGHATTCPGDVVYAWAKQGAPRPTSTTPPLQEDDMTPDQAAQLKAVYDQRAVAPWTYKGQRDRDAWAILNGLSAQVDALTPELTPADVQAIADKLAAHPALAESIAEQVAAKVAARLAN